MDADLLSGLDSSDAAIVLIVWLVCREILLHMKGKEEKSKAVEKPQVTHEEIQLFKTEMIELKNNTKALLEMHLDDNSKFSTVHLNVKVEEMERRITEILQRIELGVKK